MDQIPQTATKAHWAGIGGFIVTLILYWGGELIGFDPPPVEQAEAAFKSITQMIIESIVEATIAGGALWATVFRAPRNQPKV